MSGVGYQDGRVGHRQGFGMILAEMQSAAFLSVERATHDQLGIGDQISQFQQVRADMEVRVIFLDLILQ